jgi:endonuclease/exonuclease/phosphatase family metal-dependent hydrolase
MFKFTSIVLGGLLLPAALIAAPPGKPDIVVMTQNQYLGADLTPIIAAGTPEDYNLELIKALVAVGENNAPERVHGLAESILERKPHLVGLQEMYLFECLEAGTAAADCSLFDAAMNDHLGLTLATLGSEYYVAGVVNNLDLPGLPVFLDDDPFPDVYIRVLDRDVILARSDIETEVVPFPCTWLDEEPTPSADGCNFHTIASAPLPGGAAIDMQRGYVGVDATVNGHDYRFVNTHLEVRYPAPSQDAPLFQAAQATELLATLAAFPLPPKTRLMIVGDINSNPLNPVFQTSEGWMAYPPYKQLQEGVDILGNQRFVPYTDIWPLRPGKSPGLTCCQVADLSNDDPVLYERIDVVFTLDVPRRVKANVLDNEPEDKTPSGLWPSDHASVVGRIQY